MGVAITITAAIILLASMISKISTLPQQYCSSQNTGADSSLVQNNFQSNGACQQACAGYAFAVVQYKSCWCSNYFPADTASLSSCSVACPGYPYENCGDESAGLFGYIPLGPAPSGTQGSASSAEDSSITQATQPTVSAQPLPVAFSSANLPSVPSFSFTSSTSSVLQPSTSFNGPLTTIHSAISSKNVLTSVSIAPTTTSTSITQQSSIIPVSTSPNITTTTPTITPIALPTTPSTSSITPLLPTTYTSVRTITGQVKTLTVTPTTPPAATTTIIAAKDNNRGLFSNTGKVAGTSVAVGIIIFAIAAALIWFFLRRRRQEDAATTVGGNTPQLMSIGGSSGLQDITDQLWNSLRDNGSASVQSFQENRKLRIANPDEVVDETA